MIIFSKRFLNFNLFLILLGFFFSFNCYSQDITYKTKYLVVESNKFQGWQNPPKRMFFYFGNKVCIKEYNNTTTRGKIEQITDSSVTIRERCINLNHIKRIKYIVGVKEIKIGLISIGVSSVMIASSFILFPVKYDYYHDDDTNGWSRFYFQVPFFTTAFIGSIITGVGLIKMATNKHYRMDRDCKLYISS